MLRFLTDLAIPHTDKQGREGPADDEAPAEVFRGPPVGGAVNFGMPRSVITIAGQQGWNIVEAPIGSSVASSLPSSSMAVRQAHRNAGVVSMIILGSYFLPLPPGWRPAGEIRTIETGLRFESSVMRCWVGIKQNGAGRRCRNGALEAWR